MSTQNAKPEERKSGSDMALVSLAVILALVGVCGFSFLSDQTLLVRLGVLIGGLVFVAMVASAFSPDWGTCRLERQEKNGSLVVRKGTRLAGVFSVKPFEAVNSLQVSTEPGSLSLPTLLPPFK